MREPGKHACPPAVALPLLVAIDRSVTAVVSRMMPPHRPLRRSFCVAAAAGAALLAFAAPAESTSKAKVAAIGDAAPGGGVFAGPGFDSWPTAAGNGWIAFRGETTGGTTSETMVVAHMTPPFGRGPVASIGQALPAPAPFQSCDGKLKDFVGRAVVNANGDVAFMALIEPPADASTSTNADLGPTPAGIFVLRGGQLTPVACSGQSTAGGVLDLTAVIDPFAADDTGIADRSPALNDAGDVAFLTGYVTDKGFPNGGAILSAPAAGGFTEVVRLDGTFDGAQFVSLGPPALNGSGLIVFHGIETGSAAEVVDGVFAADANGVRMLVKNGITPMPLPPDQPLSEFEDPVSVNDHGDVAFLAGPILDPSPNASLDDEGSPGVFVWSAGVVTPLAYPGVKVANDRITGVTLGSVGGSVLAGPSITPDGTVVCFLALNTGSREVIAHATSTNVFPLVYTGGNDADPTPAGGLFAGTASAPAADAVGGVVFVARIAGGTSSEAVAYRAADGTLTLIVPGEASPRQVEGFFGGRPFSAPHMNDRGDIVFRAFVAGGPTSVGIFRQRDGALAPLVRAGDAAPLTDAPVLTDIVGEPSVNQDGAIAFAAQVAEEGRGLFALDATGLHAVAVRGDPAPGLHGTEFVGLGLNPKINDNGAIVFRGTTAYRDLLTGVTIKRDGIFFRDETGIHPIVYAEDDSPAGLPFFKLRDPLLTDAARIVFRAPLGSDRAQSDGVFMVDGGTTVALATASETLGDGTTLTAFTGDPDVTPDGQVALLLTRAGPTSPGGPPVRDLGPAIVKQGADGLDLVVARNMPGPVGGTFRSLGQPTINSLGHIVFRGGFNPFTGGTAGYFLASDDGLTPYLLRGELSPIGGRFGSLGSEAALNANDEIAFSAQVSGGKARSAIFVAAPTKLTAQLLAIRLSRGKKPRDRISIRAMLHVGRVSNGVRPAKEPVVVTLGDRDGAVWSATVPAKQLHGKASVFTLAPRRKSDLGKQLGAIRLNVGRDGAVRVAVRSAPLDVTHSGLRPLKPPFTIGVEVGDDGGRVAVPCTVTDRGARCP